MKIVITGAPNSGKSSLIAYIKKKGFKVIEENARKIIKKELKKQNGFLPWTNILEFQKIVFNEQKKKEAEIKDLTFLDTGTIEGIAYLKKKNIEIPEEIKNHKHIYDKVFILERIKGENFDGIRRESDKDSEELHKLILETYEKLGYKPVFIPLMGIEKRFEMIKKNLEKDGIIQ